MSLDQITLQELIVYSKDGEWGKENDPGNSTEMFVIRGTDFEDVRSGKFDNLPIRWIPNHIAERKKLEAGDVLIELAGGTENNPTGRTCYISKEFIEKCDKPLTVASFSRFIRFHSSKCNSKYIYWVLQFLYHYQVLKKYHVQHTGTARFQWTLFSNNEKIHIHQLKYQKKIASILSAYDDLIENNKRRIQLLEEMAEEIYKEWFVRMRFPGYENTKFYNEAGQEVPHGTAGALPEGWEKVKLKDCIKHYIGGGWGNDDYTHKFTSPAYVIRGTDIPNNKKGDLNFEVLRYHIPSNLKSRRLQSHDLVFEVSGGTETQSLGRTLFISKSLLERFDQSVICASFCKLIRINEEFVSSIIIYYLLNRLYSTGEIMLFQVQSTGISNYKFEDFIRNQWVQVPNKAIQKSFEEILYPVIDEIQVLGAKNQLLQQTRDLLLPRLISGKLRVEHLLEKVENDLIAAEPEVQYQKQ